MKVSQSKVRLISDVSEDDSDSAEYDFNETVEQNIPYSNFIYGKNRYKWSLQSFPQRRTRSDNIITNLPGVVGSAKIITSSNPIDFWNILFDNEMIEKITDYTHVKITELLISYGDTSTFTGHTVIAINAFIGLLYLSGIFKWGT